jgi:hypothetical protein
MVSTGESFHPRELGAVWAWIECLWIMFFEMAIHYIDPREGDTTGACVGCMLSFLGVSIERRVMRKMEGTFVTNIFSMACDLVMRRRFCHSDRNIDVLEALIGKVVGNRPS